MGGAVLLSRSPARTGMSRLSLIEFTSAVGDVDANIDRALHMIDRAAKEGADLVVLPELWNTGYLAGRLVAHLAEPLSGRTISALADAATQHRLWILAGSIAESHGRRPCNTSVLLDDRGRVRLVHRKVHLWTAYERRWFAAGTGFRTAQTPWGRVGIMVCYDGDFPEVPRLLALRNATILLHPSAYPARHRSDWETLYPAWARANSVFVVGINHVGREKGTYARHHWPRGVAFHGESQVLGPKGEIIYRARSDVAAVHTVNVNFRMSAPLRAGRSSAMRDRRPKEYRGLARE